MAITANPYKEYVRQDIMMASPLELIVMLYTGCIKQLKLARISIEDKQHEQTNACLQKAQDIIVELMMSLDFGYEISKELMNLYEFMLEQIVKINVNKDVEIIGPLIEMLENLRGTWIKVQKETKMKSAYGQISQELR